MNKNRVNNWILTAKEALIKTGIAENGKIDGNYRAQISSFGAAVVMGSLPAAVAFFSEQGGASVKREKLISAIYFCITGDYVDDVKKILEFVCKNNTYELREQFTDASIALKLAMNFFDMDKE